MDRFGLGSGVFARRSRACYLRFHIYALADDITRTVLVDIAVIICVFGLFSCAVGIGHFSIAVAKVIRVYKISVNVFHDFTSFRFRVVVDSCSCCDTIIPRNA